MRCASNMQSRFTNLEQILLSQLECPVCMEYMRPPIILCANGHNICNIWKQKVPHCPTCRQQFVNTRNVALEKVATELKYPCTYRSYGCREIYSFVLIGQHQQKSRYISQPCPVNKMNIWHCNWTGISSSTMSYLKQAHSHMCMGDYGLGEGSVPISGVTPDIVRFTFIFVRNDVFCSWSEIKNGLFYSVLQYIDPAADAAKYRYRLEFFIKEHTESLRITVLVRRFEWNSQFRKLRFILSRAVQSL
jgi:E3 ubiquitin-protein ligase SIAH1